VAGAFSMPAIFGLHPGDTMFTASDVGWVVGHTYIVYAPLLAGVTSVLYEGKPVGTPDAGAFFRAIEQHEVNVHFTAPTAMRVVRKEDPNGELMKKYDLSSLRAEFLAGERLDPDTYEWTTQTLAEATGRDIPVDRQLVADRDRVADRGEPARPDQVPPQARLPHQAGARLSGGDPRPERHTRARRKGGPHRHAAAAAAGNHGNGMGR
jgi:hypothetical protein